MTQSSDHTLWHVDTIHCCPVISSLHHLLMFYTSVIRSVLWVSECYLTQLQTFSEAARICKNLKYSNKINPLYLTLEFTHKIKNLDIYHLCLYVFTQVWWLRWISTFDNRPPSAPFPFACVSLIARDNVQCPSIRVLCHVSVRWYQPETRRRWSIHWSVKAPDPKHSTPFWLSLGGLED